MTVSPWLDTDLEVYEKHVELHSVGQAAAIRQALRQLVMVHKPRRVLYLGCAGGNGIEALRGVEVMGLDLNPEYIERAHERWGQTEGVQFRQWDLNLGIPEDIQADHAFGALVFEYIEDLDALIRNLARCVSKRLVVLLLATRSGAPPVSDSPYRDHLQAVGSEFRFLSTEAFVEAAWRAGFSLEQRGEIPLPSSKHFVTISLKRRL